MPEFIVRLPLGLVSVELERSGMDLGRRGGFDAQWAKTETDALSPEVYRNLAKAHLTEVYREQEGGEPPNIALNLASHQLLDDLIGWTKLNYRRLKRDDT